jgi:hypothetical protein
MSSPRHNCPDCKCEPGALHDLFCTRERCPFCGGQLASCQCIYTILNLSGDERTTVEEYIDDSVEPLQSIVERWKAAVETEGRIPW